MLNSARHSYVDLDDPLYLEFEYVQWIGAVTNVFKKPAVLVVQIVSGIDDHENQVCRSDRAHRPIDALLLDDIACAADAGCIDQRDGQSVDLQLLGDEIPCCARNLGHDRSRLAEKLFEHRR